MEEAVRPYQAPATAPGYRTPANAGVNEGDPSMTFGGNASGQTDLGPYARTDEPEDYNWFPRLRSLFAGAQEVVSEWKDVATTFEIDPNACSIWRLDCQSATLALTFAALEEPSWISRLFLWAGVHRMATVQVFVHWSVAASGETRTLTLSGVRFPSGTAPTWTPSTGRDVFHVQITSDGEKYGSVVGLDVRLS